MSQTQTKPPTKSQTTQVKDSQSVLEQVAQRLRLAAIGNRFYLFTLVACAIYAVLLLTSRFTGIFEGLTFSPLSLLVIPVAALLLAAVWHTKPSTAEAARAVDKNRGTKDLFLTYSMLDRSAGDYQSLVEADAQQQADRVDPEKVVTWEWQSRAGRIAAMASILWLAVAFLPQFDPFGKVAAAEEGKQKLVQLEKDRKTTALRKAELKKQTEAKEESDEVDMAIKELTKTFSQMKKDQPKSNRKELNDRQKEIGEKWRKLGADKLRTLLSQNSPYQDFGGKRQEKFKKWTDDLMNGSNEELKNELVAMKDQFEAMVNEKDPVKRAEMAKDLKEQLRDLQEYAQENAGSPELAAAIRRAMRQMEQVENSDNPEAAKEAMQALAESLELTEMELQELAQAAKDMKEMEEALEAIQKAKELNEEGQLDGEGTGEFQTLADYAELYAEMMGDGQGDGDGDGTGGEGIGEGGEVPEDDEVASDFKKEQEKVATRAGKILMSIKGKGMSEAGEAKKEYRQLITEVKQGVSEAISQEQVPPGYHDGIRGYFDSIDEQQSADAQP